MFSFANVNVMLDVQGHGKTCNQQMKPHGTTTCNFQISENYQHLDVDIFYQHLDVDNKISTSRC